MDSTDWTPEALKEMSRRFEHSSPREILSWALETFAPEIALATGFGPSGVVLMHLVSRLRPETTIFYLETDLLFPETYALRDQLEAELGITITPIRPELTLEAQAAEHGPALWTRDPDRCCSIRKVQPLRRFLATQRAWITGIRRDQSRTRAAVDVVHWDYANGLVKLNPLAHWSAEDIWGYIHLYDLPYNELHDRGFPSIGCQPCTQPVRDGQEERSGRWAGRSKTECGIHVQPAVNT